MRNQNCLRVGLSGGIVVHARDRGGRRAWKHKNLCPFPKTYLLDVRGRWRVMVREKKISVDRWASTAGAWWMGTDRNGNSLDRDFSTIPLPSTTVARLHDQIYGMVSAFTVQEVRTKRKRGKKWARVKKIIITKVGRTAGNGCVVWEVESEEREKCLIYTRTPVLTRRKPLAWPSACFRIGVPSFFQSITRTGWPAETLLYNNPPLTRQRFIIILIQHLLL